MSTLERADIIIVVGYSFGLADDYIFKMIVGGIKKKNSVLVMLDRSSDSIRNLQDKLSAYHLKLSYAINGDATETVPAIIKAIEEARKKAIEEKATQTAREAKKKR